MAEKESKRVICNSCGGEFEDNLPKCPFCGSFHYKGAEAEYLDKLEDIREDVEKLSQVPEEETRKEVQKQGHFLKKIFIVLGIFAVLMALFFLWENHRYERDTQEDYLWKRQNYPVMDALYEQGNYEELVDFYVEASDEDKPVYEWEHSEFCRLFDNIRLVEGILASEAAGEELNQYDYSAILYYGFKMQSALQDTHIAPEDLEILKPSMEVVLEDFNARWDFTQKELKEIEQEKSKHYGYVSYAYCDKYIKKWMKGREDK